ncbi:TetR/AcrR family transcriptional regulator [Nocardiopsis sp. EMB25]|uniref:TetR/AcrR family transcriptional regulator n=1 Tax=Nocardiopsis sp. EMB25 TaxID=2835867 RepID=UPI0022840F54|nr:TetR/AcrR family transcriptional regulator [Nocardiopsis sp. EMB25]MCY9785753.1 TetR/AcrR family transcriptional regulator [Nocardiopsis sp. EMB25]
MPRVSDAYLAQRREHILTAAAACFARDGFHRTSMRNVIDEAGLSPGAVYRYFRGKDDIIVAIALDAIGAVQDVVRESIARRRPFPELVGELPATIEAMDRADSRTRLAVQAWGEALRDTALRDALSAGLDGVLDQLRARVELGRADGQIPERVDPAATARVLLGLVQGYILQRAWDPDLSAADYGRAARDLVVGSLSA